MLRGIPVSSHPPKPVLFGRRAGDSLKNWRADKLVLSCEAIRKPSVQQTDSFANRDHLDTYIAHWNGKRKSARYQINKSNPENVPGTVEYELPVSRHKSCHLPYWLIAMDTMLRRRRLGWEVGRWQEAVGE